MNDVLFHVCQRWLQTVRIGPVVEVKAASEKSVRAVRSEKLQGAGNRTGQGVEYAADVFFRKVEGLGADASSLDFVAEHHLVRILYEGTKMVLVREGFEGAMEFG